MMLHIVSRLVAVIKIVSITRDESTASLSVTIADCSPTRIEIGVNNAGLSRDTWRKSE